VKGARALPWLLFALAAAVRGALLAVPTLWYDEATVGIAGLALLHGQLPVYFFGQPFMGTLGDAYLAAPLYVLAGASARTVEAAGVLASLGWLALVIRLAGDVFGPRAAAFTALLLVVPPNYLLHWSHEGRPHYPLAMALGTLGCALALRAPIAPPGRRLFLFALLGGTVGMAVWTNLLSVVFLPAIALLAVQGGWRPLTPGAAVAAPAFLLGSLPHWLYAVPHGTAVPPAGGHISGAELLRHLGWAAGRSWPTLAGVPAAMAGHLAGSLLALGLAALYAAALVPAARAWRAGPAAVRAGIAACAVLALTTVGVAVGTRYGRFLEDDPRYLLPLYTALPPLLGLGLARLPRPAALGVAAALVVGQAAGAAAGDLYTLTAAGAAEFRAFDAAVAGTVAGLERAGLTRLYAADFGLRVLTFVSGERVIFSSHYEEINPRYALAVDGAPRAAWWIGRRVPEFEANLRAVGVDGSYRPVGPLGGVYTDFRLRGGPVREVDHRRLTVTASEAAPAAAWTVDRDVGTLWRTARPKQGGEWLRVDLGAVEPVALLRLLPGTYQEVPDGLRLEASRDGERWTTLIELPRYMGPLYWSAGRPMGRVRSGRVELRVPPTEARYLRLTQLGRSALWHWTVRELFVYAAAAGAPPAPADADGRELAAAVRAADVSRLYADHGWGSRVALAEPAVRILPADLYLDPYGWIGSARALWPSIRWRPGAGMLVEPADAAAVERLAREQGLGVSRRPAAGLVLFAYAPPPPRPGTPLPAGALRVSASREPGRAARAADGDPATRWATARPQAAGDWVRVDLDRPRTVRAVRLWTPYASDSPRGLALEVSGDGITWRPVGAARATEGPLRWGGTVPLRDGVTGVRLDFAPVRAAALRLTLTAGDPVFDWSIHELTVYE